MNLPALTTPACARAADVRWVLTRVFPAAWGAPADVRVCGNGGRLPAEAGVVRREGGCFASVSAVDARTKLDAGRGAQAGVLARLGGVLGCLPPS